MIIVTHTDLDGICSAALFIRKYGNKVEIKYASVNEAKELHQSGFSPDYTCDLPKIGRSINIDHHKSNYENLLANNRISEGDSINFTAPSATDLVFRHLEFLNDPIALQIRELGNLADTAQLPKEYKPLDVIVNMNSSNYVILRDISALLAFEGKNILKTEWLTSQHEQVATIYSETQLKIDSFIKKNQIFPRILILDTRGKINEKLAKEVFEPFFKFNIAIIALIYIKTPDEPLKVSLRVKKSEQENYDVSLVAKALNGGGHRMAAGCNPNPQNFPLNLINELKKIKKPTDSLETIILE